MPRNDDILKRLAATIGEHRNADPVKSYVATLFATGDDASGEIPSKKVDGDEEILAFHDINPQAAVHFMLIPKKHIDSLSGVSADDVPLLGRMLAMTGRLARGEGSPEGFRTIINTGRVGR